MNKIWKRINMLIYIIFIQHSTEIKDINKEKYKEERNRIETNIENKEHIKEEKKQEKNVI